MSQATSARAARPFALVVSLAATAIVAVACTPAARANGDSCIKDTDCLSGLCAQMVCSSLPPLLDAEVNGEAGKDAGPDAPGDATVDTGSPPVDSGTAQEAASDAAGDSPAETGDDGATDAPADGPTDSGAADVQPG